MLFDVLLHGSSVGASCRSLFSSLIDIGPAANFGSNGSSIAGAASTSWGGSKASLEVSKKSVDVG